VALENVFQRTATEFDGLLVTGMDAAIGSGLMWARPQLTIALGLYVIGYGLMMMYGKSDGWTFALAAARAVAVSTILVLANYNYYVRDLFFTVLPNELARAINGPRVTVNSAQQFDVIWSAVIHYTSYILAQATGLSHMDDRGIAWLLAYVSHGALWVCFGMWYISRVFMAVVISMGPFIIILFLFRSTREYVQQWIGKLVGLTALGLGSAIVLRLVMMVMSSQLMVMQRNPGMSVDEMLANAQGVTGIFWLGALMMIILPSVISIGAGMGAGHAVASGMISSGLVMVGRKSVQGARFAGKAGVALGKFTGKQ
jgi:type IV secretory pathway VirB6-like protein